MNKNKEDTCRVLLSDSTSECGEPAVAKVTIRGRVTSAQVPVCAKHKAEHNEGFARLRAATR